jgi:hypothetical protein
MIMNTYRNCPRCKRRFPELDAYTGWCTDCHNNAINGGEIAWNGKKFITPKGPSTGRPAWCGKCDERTRLYEWQDETRIEAGYDPTVVSRCQRCHPLAGRPTLRLAG